MPAPIPRRTLLQAGMAAGLWLAIPSARACEFWSTRLRVYLPRSRATAPGDTVAVLCMTFDQVLATDRLIGVETPVAASAEMGGEGSHPGIDFLIPAGRDSVLSEDGTFIRLVGLRQPLELGCSYALTLVFEHAGAVKADIDIDQAHST